MRTASPRGAKGACDRLFSRIVRSRGACESCGQPATDCAHIVSRRYSATRCDETNALALCRKCHMHYTNWPLEFAAFVTDRVGADCYRRLRDRAQAGGKVDWADLSVALRERARALGVDK